ncbi:MFS transporter [Silicimonas algicola]|uniref:Cyanate permease n=1 Tax=Silicimonas algicola TaxID=1826607 RepID=A0A316G9B3_9RHOB|nr:MFS transporter [Silicimonas algicola]AZQ67516.1 MFS transporter [Silicimonas algicola]PWK57212.1 cyanate permease [Silicimonas algicola]
MELSEHDSRYSWTRLAISLGLSVVGNVGMWAVIVILPALQAEFDISRAGASLPYTATMAGFAAGNFFLGRAVDRFGISTVLAAAGAALSAGFALSALAPSLLGVTLIHALLGFGASASFAPLMADISHWFLKRRGLALAIAASGNYASGAAWSPVIAWIMIDHGWRGAYLAIALTVAVVMIPGALLLRRRIDAATTARAATDAASRARSVALSPRALQALLMLAGVGCCVAMSMPQVHIVALCIDRGFGAAAGAEMLSLMLLGGVVSRLTFGALADRLGGLRTLLLGGTLQMLALALFLIEGNRTSLSLVSLIFGLSQGGIVPSYAIIIREYLPPAEAGRRVGAVIAATIVGMALGGWMTGWLYDQTGSYALSIWNGIGWNLLNVGIVAALLLRMGSGPRLRAA